jgi:hypothetical protein
VRRRAHVSFPMLPNRERTMTQKLQVLFELPDEGEIETTREVKESSDVITKTIRYRNGVTVILHQDFRQSVYALEVRPPSPCWIKGKQLILTG